MIGYGAAGGLLTIALVVVVVLLVAGGGGGEDKATAALLPSGGNVPDARHTNLAPSVNAAGCPAPAERRQCAGREEHEPRRGAQGRRLSEQELPRHESQPHERRESEDQ